jgi:hypothetical protein
MSREFSERDWRILVQRVRDKKCTPFLGAGVAYGVLPLGGEIAKRLAEEYGYPMEDTSNLMAVSQYIAVRYDPLFVKEEIVRMFSGYGEPSFADPLEPHSLLADFPLPVYVTTNYDNFMTRALELKNRDAKRVLCRWNPSVEDYAASHPTPFDADPQFEPTVANPVVFHMHGYSPVAESFVLTEDDYLEFLTNMSRGRLLPPLIERRLTGTSLLFIGYRLADWNFRVLLRSLSQYNIRAFNVAVMPPPSAPKAGADGRPEDPGAAEERRQKAQEYLTRYYENIDVHVYWGSAREFLSELSRRVAAPDDPAGRA